MQTVLKGILCTVSGRYAMNLKAFRTLITLTTVVGLYGCMISDALVFVEHGCVVLAFVGNSYISPNMLNVAFLIRLEHLCEEFGMCFCLFAFFWGGRTCSGT